MNWIKSILLTTLLVLGFTCPSQAQKLKLAEGYLTDSGKPLANQNLQLEGKTEPRWYDFFGDKGTKVKVNALTDEHGFLQFVDLPPGEYTLKLVRAGEEPVSLTTFKLEPGYSKTDITTKLKLKEYLQLNESLIKKHVLSGDEMQKSK
jgi:Prealbumin-like fold domain